MNGRHTPSIMRRVPVVNGRGERVGDVAASATSVGAAKVCGEAVEFRKHDVHGWCWQAVVHARKGTPL